MARVQCLSMLSRHARNGLCGSLQRVLGLVLFGFQARRPARAQIHAMCKAWMKSRMSPSATGKSTARRVPWFLGEPGEQAPWQTWRIQWRLHQLDMDCYIACGSRQSECCASRSLASPEEKAWHIHAM
jgi:hypothetical protein